MGRTMVATPTAIHRVLMEWVGLPSPDDNLGHRLLHHLAASGVPVLGYDKCGI